MKTLTKAICLPLVIGLCPISAQAKDEKAWATASDIGVAGLTIAALGRSEEHSLNSSHLDLSRMPSSA